MLHLALSRALATTRIEDLHRAATRSQTIRLARGVGNAPHVAEASTQLGGLKPRESQA
jgi:hypothetical protein